MKCLIVLFAVAAVSNAQLIISPYAPAPISPYAHSPITPLRTQYHAQNELGQYSFGYTGGPSSKHETSSGVVTQGAFSYVDAHGLVQSRSYVADPHGFRVAATDIPVDANTPVAHAVAHPVVALARRKRQVFYSHVAPVAPVAPLAHAFYPAAPVVVSAGPADTPEVAAAKVAHYHQYNYESLRNAGYVARRKRSAIYVAPGAIAAPAVYHAVPSVYHAAPVFAPAVHAAPVVAPVVAPAAPVVAPAVTSQYHAQDELGQYSYGYSNPTSSKTETRFANGITQGGYSYVDSHGLVQSASYVSDPAHGFRVAATNLPVAPVA